MSLLDRLVQNSAPKTIYYSKWDGPDVFQFKLPGSTSYSQGKQSSNYQSESPNHKNKRFSSQPKRQIQLTINPRVNPQQSKILMNMKLFKQTKDNFSQTQATNIKNIVQQNRKSQQIKPQLFNYKDKPTQYNKGFVKLQVLISKTTKSMKKHSYGKIYSFAILKKQIQQRQKITNFKTIFNTYEQSIKVYLIGVAFNKLKYQISKINSLKSIQSIFLKINDELLKDSLQKLKKCPQGIEKQINPILTNQPLQLFSFPKQANKNLAKNQQCFETEFFQERPPTRISYLYQNSNNLSLPDNNDTLNIFLDVKNHKFIEYSNHISPFYETNSKFNFQSDEILYEIEAQKRYHNQQNIPPTIDSLTVSNISHINDLYNSKTVRIICNNQPSSKLKSQKNTTSYQQQVPSHNQFDEFGQNVTKSMLATFQPRKKNRNYSSHSDFSQLNKKRQPIQEHEQFNLKNHERTFEIQEENTYEKGKFKSSQQNLSQQQKRKKNQLLKKFMKDFESSPKTMKQIKAARIGNKNQTYSKQKKTKRNNVNYIDNGHKVSNTFKKKNSLPVEPFALQNKYKSKAHKKTTKKQQQLRQSPQIAQQKYLNNVLDSIIHEAIKGKKKLQNIKQQKKIKSNSKAKDNKLNFQLISQPIGKCCSPEQKQRKKQYNIQYEQDLQVIITPKIKQFADLQFFD